jgi:hypothetical protein
MTQFTPKSAALFALSSLTMALLMQACGGSDDARAQTVPPADPIEGFWQSTVALQDCSSGAPLGGFRGLTIFAAGGAATADNNQPPMSKGIAIGTWKKNATGTYVAELRFWRYQPDGAPAGQQRLTRTLTLAADGKTLTGTISSVSLDTGDNAVRTVCGTENGARVGS